MTSLDVCVLIALEKFNFLIAIDVSDVFNLLIFLYSCNFTIFSPFFKSSSLSRKLDKIHDLLLKKADDQLYYRLKELSIPPQTYGMYVNINYVRSLLL